VGIGEVPTRATATEWLPQQGTVAGRALVAPEGRRLLTPIDRRYSLKGNGLPAAQGQR
jgi:hypothetical protein